MTQSGAEKYEAVIGLEVHAQLLTKSKLFSGDSAQFGAAANTHISPITLGYPGTLPKLNKEAVTFAIRIGIACGCEIEGTNYFARKNYFYPDLPKGYQLTQHTTPICKGGYVHIRTSVGERQVKLNRIHLEEDAGKSLHDIDPDYTGIDYNRAGVPLIEIVSEPDMHSGEEAYAYLTELRKLVRFLGICDGNMEEGSMRCDANVSIRLKGEKTLGTKVEVKNLNSIRNVRKAIEHEIQRMIVLAERGEPIIQQTRSYDAGRDLTFSMRTKEEANDYRYFPDPDLPPFVVTRDFVETIRLALPELPEALVAKYTGELQLSEYDARFISDDKETVHFFEQLIRLTSHAKAAANWMIGPLKSYLNEHAIGFGEFPLAPAKIAALVDLVHEGLVNFSIASTRIFPVLINEPDSSPAEIARRLNLIQDSDAGSIEQWVEQVLSKMPEKVTEYKNGKKGLIGLFMGEVKKLSGGKADPKVATKLLSEKLSKRD